MKKYFKKNRGFTLLEAIIYIALYTIIIGGVVAGVYAIFNSSSRNTTKSMIQEEGIFLEGKISWALTGAAAVAVANLNQQLSINSNGVPSGDNPLVFDILGTDMRLTRGTASPTVLNNSNIQVTNVSFVRTLASGDGAVPESIKASFTLSSRTPSGRVMSQDFSFTKYLRK